MKVLAWLNFIVLGIILFIAASSLKKENKNTKELQSKIKQQDETIYQLQTAIEKGNMEKNELINNSEKNLKKISDMEASVSEIKKEIFEVKQKNDILQKDLSEKDIDMARMIKVLKDKKLKI